MANVYYYPEEFGLKVVTEVGCSCPCPFEDVNTLEDLATGTVWDAIGYLGGRLDEAYDWAHKDNAVKALEDLVNSRG